MPVSSVTLVALPKSLFKGIDRRLPRGRRFKDVTGKRYRYRTVLGFAGFKGSYAAWLCRCKCGALSVVLGAKLEHNGGQSCGCAVRRISPAAKKLKPTLDAIKARCYRPSDGSYVNYGACGITVCKRWRQSLEAFAEDMGPRPSPNHFVVRRDKRGNYTLANCYWGTREELTLSRRNVSRITCAGKTQSSAQWARELGISREAMRRRVQRCLKLGLPLSMAITNPPKPGRPRKQ